MYCADPRLYVSWMARHGHGCISTRFEVSFFFFFFLNKKIKLKLTFLYILVLKELMVMLCRISSYARFFIFLHQFSPIPCYVSSMRDNKFIRSVNFPFGVSSYVAQDETIDALLGKFYGENGSLFWDSVEEGVWEPNTFSIFKSVITNQTTVIDFGSWIGPTILFAAHFAHEVYSIEPDSTAFFMLQKNLNANKNVLSNIKILRRCISIREETVIMKPGPLGPGDSMSTVTRNINCNGNECHDTVPCNTLLSFIKEFNIKSPLFIKVDVEGLERELFATWHDIIQLYQPSIFISIHQHLGYFSNIEAHNFMMTLKLFPIIIISYQNNDVEILKWSDSFQLCSQCDYFCTFDDNNILYRSMNIFERYNSNTIINIIHNNNNNNNNNNHNHNHNNHNNNNHNHNHNHNNNNNNVILKQGESIGIKYLMKNSTSTSSINQPSIVPDLNFELLLSDNLKYKIYLYYKHHLNLENQLDEFCIANNISYYVCLDVLYWIRDNFCWENSTNPIETLDEQITMGKWIYHNNNHKIIKDENCNDQEHCNDMDDETNLSLTSFISNNNNNDKDKMDKNAFITFIIPSTGRSSLLRTVFSLAALKITNWKAIVILDNATLPSPWIITDNRIRYLKVLKQDSVGMVRNIGMKVADTEWVGFLDDDDTLSMHTLNHFEEEISLNKDIDCIIFRLYDNEKHYLPPNELQDDTFQLYYVGISFFMKRNLIYEGFSFGYSHIEDFCLLNIIRKAGKKMVISPYTVYFVRQYPFEVLPFSRVYIN